MLDTLLRPADPEARAASGRRALAGGLERSAARWMLAAIVLVGVYLRFADVGDLGFRWDEDLSGLAVQAVLEKGYPELPSGMIYLRGGPHLYLMAGSAWLFGFNELALRLPSVLFGIGLIFCGFVFARALFGVRAGLIVAALLSISAWDVEFSRYARMYAPFTVFYVLTLYCIWKSQIAGRSTPAGVAAIVLAVFAVWMHELGYSLAAAFFYPLVIAGPTAWTRPREWRYPLAGAFAVGAFFLAWGETMRAYRHIPAEASAAAGEAASAGIGAEPALMQYLQAFGDFPLLPQLLDQAPLVLPVLVAVLGLAALWFGAKRRAPLIERLLLLGVAIFCALQLFNLAIVAILLLAYLKRTGLPALRSAEVLFAAALFAAALTAWVALIVGLDLTAGDGSLRMSVRELVNYPHYFVFWGFVDEWPMAAIVAAIGGAWAFDRASRGQPSRHYPNAKPGTATAAAFLLLAFATPLIANGLFASDFEFFRYNVPYDTLFFTFIALGILHWRAAFGAVGALPQRALSGAAAAAGTAALVLLAVGFDLNPLRSWLVTERQYANDGALYRAFGMTRYDDFKTVSGFVAANAAPGDVIITPDSREIYNYLGRVDYWIRSYRYEDQSYTKDGVLRDLYIDTPVVMTLAELRGVLDEPNQTKWVLASDNHLTRSPSPLATEIQGYLLEQREHVVYEALDGNRRVYKFE